MVKRNTAGGIQTVGNSARVPTGLANLADTAAGFKGIRHGSLAKLAAGEARLPCLSAICWLSTDGY